jgi:hypothetical protein
MEMAERNIRHFIRHREPRRLVAVAVSAFIGFLIVFALTKDRSFYYAIAAALVVGTVMYLHSLGWQHRAKPHSK